MGNSFLTNYFSLTEWWHYVILLLWIFLLLIGIKYYPNIETLFKKKDESYDGKRSGQSMLIASFSTGLAMVILWMFKPANISAAAELNWSYVEIAFYGLIVLLLLVNAIVSVLNYTAKSGLIRLIVLSIFMLVYFYTGMFGGLLILSVFVLVVVIYFLVKFKNILKIR